MTNYLISIVGPTAVGKTATSIALAKAFDTEIVSADSRQFYKEMSIGTAVPSKEERAAVPHHFIQHLSIDQEYSVGDFETDTLRLLNRLFQEHRCVFLVGGSGLYHNAITEGLDKFPEVEPGLRAQLNQQLKTEGIAVLQNRLKALDPDYAATADLKNPHRVIRALEVSLSSDKPFSYFRNQPKPPRPFKTLKIGLEAPRSILYDRIEKRVDLMMASGLLDEAEKLLPKRHKNALNTIGYKELFRYFDDTWPLDKAIDEIKKNSRRFAKRQLTWFRKDNTIKWFPFDGPTADIEDYIRSQIKV